jgi:uncharacterized membrane protein YidH (DUF202 family)
MVEVFFLLSLLIVILIPGPSRRLDWICLILLVSELVAQGQIFWYISVEFGLVVKNANINSNPAAATASLFGHYQSSLIGISIIILGIALILLALRNYLTTRSYIDKGFYIPSNFNIFAASTSLVVLGILIIVYLFVVLPANNP